MKWLIMFFRFVLWLFKISIVLFGLYLAVNLVLFVICYAFLYLAKFAAS